MKIISYNVNGIRSAMSKNLVDWMDVEKPDVLCLQEIKAEQKQVDTALLEQIGYQHYWYPSQKKGYSGVAIFTKIKPNHVEYGSGNELFDSEGRIIRADFDNVSVISVYMPSGTSGDERQGIKYEFLDFFYQYIKDLLVTHPNLVIAGDYNIAHHPIDIHDPKGNAKSSGFLPAEREWLTKFMTDLSFTDTFRQENPNTKKYSWWTFRFNARSNNKGWRIDYQLVSKPLVDKIIDAEILNDAVHSDHCPVMLEIGV